MYIILRTCCNLIYKRRESEGVFDPYLVDQQPPQTFQRQPTPGPGVGFQQSAPATLVRRARKAKDLSLAINGSMKEGCRPTGYQEHWLHF